MQRFLVASSLAAAIVAVGACSSSSSSSATDTRVERTDLIRRGDTPLTLIGPTLDVGAPMPDVVVADAKLAPIHLGSLRGKVIVLSVVPSIDTRVCENQTHHVNAAVDRMPPGVVVYTISRDLPFAQQRFAEEALVPNLQFGSDYKGGAFGRAFGLDVKETGLLARSVWVIGKDGKIAYREIVPDQGTEPDIEKLVAAVERVAG